MNTIFARIKNATLLCGRWLFASTLSVCAGFWHWVSNLFVEEYELIVWFHAETIVGADGLKSVSRSKKIFQLSRLTKHTPKHISGKDQHGNFFEVRTVEPFDYSIRKLK